MTRKRHFVNLALICCGCCLLLNSSILSVRGQFLFTYEINQDDDSRAPKSSLFDPNSFKIVTPAQLASSYQKLSSSAQLSEPSNQLVDTQDVVTRPATVASAPATSGSNNESPSLLKQTSAALQSFAELFNLSPSSSPAPLPISTAHHNSLGLGNIDQQAEARSLHEHWTQQQQKSHQNGFSHSPHSALDSFTTTTTAVATNQPPPAAPLNQIHQFQHQNTQNQQPQPQTHTSQASYWLTANPLNSQDGNFLVQIKQPTQQQQQQQQTMRQLMETAPEQPHLSTHSHSHPTSQHHHNQHHHIQTPVVPQLQLTSPASVVDNLLSLGAPRSTQYRSMGSNNQKTPVTSNHGRSHLAQDSFLSTPTSYYPSPSETSARRQQPPQTAPPMPVQQAQHTQPSQHVQQQQQQQHPFTMSRYSNVSSFNNPALEPTNSGSRELSPPVNLPKNFALNQPIHKSAEESLISFRQQLSDQQHDQQNALFTVQDQLASQHQYSAQQEQQQQQREHSALNEKQVNSAPQRNVYHQHQQPSPPSSSSNLGEIPKVSPQIYESFLLQRKDQQEKHMELLKQQQELNRLMEQRQKQQELEKEKEARRKRKKDELEREAQRKKAQAKELELARKAKLEAEEREMRRKRDEEERKYREYLDAERRREQEREREREIERQQQQAAEAEAAKKREAESKYQRQQEELKKLLELKQLEEEAEQRHRKQVAAQQQQQQQQPQPQRSLQAMRANRIAQELRDRVGGQSWGAPIRSSRVQSSTTSNYIDSLSLSSTQAPPTTSSSTQSTTTSEKSERRSSEQQVPPKRQRIATRVVKKQRNSGEEKLIRQKIPLYSGPGQYGLYRGANVSTASELAALLNSVSLPPISTSTITTTTTTTTTSAPPHQEVEPSERSNAFSTSSTTMATFQDQRGDMSSSLSPLLIRTQNDDVSSQSIAFDDDVPRRPARGLTTTAKNQLSQSTSSNRQLTTSVQNRFNESSSFPTSTTAHPSSRGHAHIGLASLPPDTDNDGIPGRAGIEYPVLSSVPSTSFSCSRQPLNGYYADTETACQVVHLCQGGAQSSILCPNGTIFNQEKFSCQWWYEVNCSRAPIFYQLNDNLYKASRETSTSAEKNNNSSQDEAADDEEEEEEDKPKPKPKPKQRRKRPVNVDNKQGNRIKLDKANSNSLLSAAS